MTNTQKPDRGLLELDEEECKGCGLCVEACPPDVLYLAEHLNHYGLHPVAYRGAECTGCGICFFVCPEPGAITVLRLASRTGIPACPEDQTPGTGIPACPA